MILGQRFKPGSDIKHFCQPTSVAVLPSSEIVVADGYCNSRLVLFDKRGNPKYTIDESMFYIANNNNANNIYINFLLLLIFKRIKRIPFSLIKLYFYYISLNINVFVILGWMDLRIPHALTVLPNSQVCIADREHLRIVCLDVIYSGFKENLKPLYSIRHRQFGRIFGIAAHRK